MGIAEDVIIRSNKLFQDRSYWAEVWMQIARLVVPSESAVNSFNSIIQGPSRPSSTSAPGTIAGPISPQIVKNIYDNTGMLCVDRLTAGIESLVTPQSEMWHGLEATDFMSSAKASTEEQIYLERLRDLQFKLRYDPRAGFIPAHQKALRSCIAFGTGIIMTEEDDGRNRPGDPPGIYRYRYCPITDSALGTNDQGNPDTNYRKISYTLKQAVQKFGADRLSVKLRTLYEQGKDLDRPFGFIHAVCPREEMGSYALRSTVRGSAIASYYVEEDEKWLVTDGGFFEFPYSVYHWLQQDNGPYAESPVMLALSEIKSLQAMGKSELRAFAQWTDPPLGMVNDGVMNRPNLNPRAVNIGAIGPDGSRRVQPLLTSQNPDFAEKVMDARRSMVKETLYINLFQILIKNPQMTATEAMLRANEKGELLGPAGGKIQMALSVMADREMGILERRGLFTPRSAFAPPRSLAGKNVGVKFTSPLDRLRRANQGVGIARLLEMVLPIAKVKPEVLDKFDLDEVINQLREIHGAPAPILVTDDVLKQRRAATNQKMSTAENLQAGQAAANIGKDASIAGRNVGETAQQGPQIMSALSEILDRLKGGVQGSPDAPQPAIDSTNALLSQFGKPPVQPQSGL